MLAKPSVNCIQISGQRESSQCGLAWPGQREKRKAEKRVRQMRSAGLRLHMQSSPLSAGSSSGTQECSISPMARPGHRFMYHFMTVGNAGKCEGSEENAGKCRGFVSGSLSPWLGLNFKQHLYYLCRESVSPWPWRRLQLPSMPIPIRVPNRQQFASLPSCSFCSSSDSFFKHAKNAA